MWSELVLQSGRSLRCCCFFFLFFFCGVILLYAFPFVGLSALFVLLLSLECFLSLYLGFLVLFSFHFLCFFCLLLLVLFGQPLRNSFRVVSGAACLWHCLYISGEHGVLPPILMPRFLLPSASTDGGPQR